MRYLLAAINAKYIHSNLGIYSLRRYAMERLGLGQKREQENAAEEIGCVNIPAENETIGMKMALGEAEEVVGMRLASEAAECANRMKTASEIQIDLGEYTINHQMDQILQDIYRRKPDVVGFSCYIWNIVYVKELIHDLKKVLPQTRIWLGGPEASYDAVRLMGELPEVELIMQGEGEETFTRLVEACERGGDMNAQGLLDDGADSQSANQSNNKTGQSFRMDGQKGSLQLENSVMENSAAENRVEVCFSEIPGIVLRCSDGTVEVHRPAPLMNLDDIPFSYGDLSGLEHRIIYYESSRGCPFSCSYCLSSIDKKVRFRSLSLVTKELQFFLDRKVPQVKFVDRTFNCKKSHSMAIWQYLLDHDNGITNFHFEISSDLLDDDELALMKQMRPGLIQLEIGVQTTNPVVVKEIRRTMDLDKVARRVVQVNAFGNIHQHLDLIAGLPYEDIESFHRSFNDVYKMEPEQLQLGFLKVLKGSYMEEMKQKYGLLSQSKPPYEVLRTNWLSYEEVIRLKGVEEMVEVYYNSGQFRRTMKRLSQEWGDAFDLYDRLAAFYEEEGLNGVSHNRLARYEILYRFIQEYENQEKKIANRADGRILVNENALKMEEDAASKQVLRTLVKDKPEQAGNVSINETSYQALLIYDLYLRENVKSRPSFAPDPSEWKNETKQFFMREAKERRYLKGYEAYDSRQMAKMTHLERMEEGNFVLFDYKNRDALFGNAAAFSISRDEIQREM